MRRALLLLCVPAALVPCAFVACGGGDSSSMDASNDVTVIDVAPDVPMMNLDAGMEAEVIVPPEQAIWVASETTLYRFDPIARVMKRIADFDCSGEPMIDLAMNAQEQLYGITSESVMEIDKTTGVCTPVARGAQSLPYASAFVPADALEAGVEKWLGYKYTTYDQVDPDSGALTFAGALGGSLGSFQASGDMVTIPGGKTYLTAFSFDPQTGDAILEIDPNTGAAKKVDGFTSADTLLGLAQWAGTMYVFTGQGRIYAVKFLGDSGVGLQTIGVTYDYGDASTDASDASDGGDAEAGPPPPSFIFFRGAASSTRAPGN